jgi:NAD(P)-dependent dehydrogenase (short-subunit alcohol dehydrogenase family)
MSKAAESRFQGQRTVILGGTSGIGLATAATLTAAGAEVLIAGRDPAKLKAAVGRLGAGARGEAIDAGDRAALETLYRGFGSFHHLVITLSGAAGAGLFRELKLDDLRRGFEAKFWPHLHAAQVALPHLLPGGSILFVTAASAGHTLPGTSGLAAINGAIEMMVPILAAELKPVRVNAVSPGVVDTPWWDHVPAEQRAGVLAGVSAGSAVGRPGRPEEIADAIAFILGSAFTTGTILHCDGGVGLP